MCLIPHLHVLGAEPFGVLSHLYFIGQNSTHHLSGQHASTTRLTLRLAKAAHGCSWAVIGSEAPGRQNEWAGGSLIKFDSKVKLVEVKDAVESGFASIQEFQNL